jgi:hypothetical protein
MAAQGAPVVEGVSNTFAGEDFGEEVGWATVFPLTGSGRDVDVAGGQLAVDPGVSEIGKVVDRIVKVKIVVVHAVHEVFEIINAGHSKAAFDDVGMFEERVGGVICAEGGAHGGDGDTRRLAIVPDERDDFFAEVGIKNGLNVAAMKGMGVLVVKTVAIDGVDGEKFESASVDKVGECANQALAFEFPFVAGAGGKTEQRRTPVAVDDDTHFNAESGGMPTVVFTFHALGLTGDAGRRKYASGAVGGANVLA